MESGGTYGALHLNDQGTPRVHGLLVSGEPDINVLREGGGGEEEESEQELPHGRRLGQQGRRELCHSKVWSTSCACQMLHYRYTFYT